MSSSSIYRSSPAKKPKPTNQSQGGGGGGGSAGGGGGGGGGGAGWTVVGGVAGVRNTYPWSGKHWGGTVNIRNRRNSALPFGVCDTCGVYYNFNSTYQYYYTRFVHTIRYYAVGSQCTPSSDQCGYI